ncbi:MAG: IS200/IS605 family element transposase accessory protein TnpB [Burkholderiales bacterium]|nr:IS200/IS605 family element transposase accessory protein TnpB [Burkholderiales bacterium]
MQRLQAYKFELRPNGHQQRQMLRFAGACRFVFNRALAEQKANHAAGQTYIGYVAMAKRLTAWRNDPATPWLREAPVHPLQHALKDLERAYTNFFAKRAAFPKFKKRGQHDSLRYPDPKQIKVDQANGRIFLPKLGWMRLRLSRPVPGLLKNVTVSMRAGRWFVSIQTERDVAQPAPHVTIAVGIDLGIARFATFSDGSFIAPLSSFRRHEARLRRYQRAMSRKVKGSNNWRRAKARVQRIHARIGNVRADFLHKATTRIAREHALVCIEDLAVRNMSRSASGTVEAPGSRVRAKSGLNKAILDQGWFEFRRQLEYKLAWAGGHLIAVPPAHTSRTCPACGHVAAENRTTQARFACVACGHSDHADVVGAINILARGHRVAACGEPVQLGRSTKQEPAEAI